MSLYRAETRRLVKRRFTRVFVVLTLLVLGLIVGGVGIFSTKLTPAVTARAQTQATAEYQSALEYAAEEKRLCAVDSAAYGGDCDSIYQPTPGDYEAQWYLPFSFNFGESFEDMLVVLTALLAMVAFAIGASFVGVEWRNGGMMNLLLWRPRRAQVLLTKLGALLAGLVGLTVVTGLLWTATFWAIGRFRGDLGKLTPGVWQSFGLTGLRALALVVVAGALGFGLASIGRHTAAAFGVAIGALVVMQFGLSTVLNMASARYADLYLADKWVTAWMYKSAEVIDWSAPCDYASGGNCEQPVFTITWQMAGGLLTALFVLVTVVAMWTFRKRDIA
ncbi:ABC transporter permease subunit [Actinoplanes sp. NBRC 101535]|uniref:ABC transporter permease n=1 Tax=Actinoplanes sp. NBRC 101535 TaxID=3032196 RepID=UPI00249FAF03|nr:ABC transporter permease subunit [Actinoplanes sp. NBRC 101535]GLY08046.1 hypothetical protein Acsp01_84250 [Actinoplanes sp. NBRC 101535]